MRRRDKLKPSASSAPARPEPDGGGRTSSSRQNVPLSAHDGLVLLCIVIVSAAISMMLFAQFGVSLSVSAIAGAGAWAVVDAHSQAGAEVGADRATESRTGAHPRRWREAEKRRCAPAPMSYIEAAAQAGIDIRMPDAADVSRQADDALRDAAMPDAAQPDVPMQRSLPTGEFGAAPTTRQPALPDSLIDLHLRPVPDLLGRDI